MDFPLWRLRPEDAARIIILAPLEPVERHKFWHKREMRIRPSKRNVPRVDDLRRMGRAAQDAYWEAFEHEFQDAYPTVGLLIGPLPERPDNPLLDMHQDGEWARQYTLDDFEWDMLYFEHGRRVLWQQFVKGQIEGPKIDALIFQKADNLMLAEQARFKARYKLATEIRARQRKARVKPIEHWQNIGRDEAMALGFKHSGYEVRKIDTIKDQHYEVKLK